MGLVRYFAAAADAAVSAQTAAGAHAHMSTHGDPPPGESGAGGGVLGGARRWGRRWWRALLAELLATALLVALGAASLLPAAPGAARPLAEGALCFGFLVVTLVAAFGDASGAHMNPAVTLAALLARRLPAGAAAGYAVAQVLGAVAGYAALAALVPAARVPGTGCTAPGAGVAPAAAALLEALLTAPLALLCGAAWAAPAPHHDPALPIKLGLTVAGVIFAGGPLTGASINPARSLGPALFHGHWEHHWVYWVGPLGGAALAVLLQAALSARAPRAAAPPRELQPLADKLEPC